MEDHDDLRAVADLTAGAEDLEALVRPVLALLARTTGLDTTVLTLHDRKDDTQVWRFVHNEGRIEVPEGFGLPWMETLCQRMIVEDRNVIEDVGEELPDHPAHAFLGVRGFVSMPYALVGRGGQIAGTLCGGSLDRVEIDPETVSLFELMSRLIADRLGREIELGRERIRAERAEQRLHERSTFVAATEHALKSPLSVISGWSEMLATRYLDMDDAERLQAVDRIRRCAARLWDHVDDLLDEARATVLGAELQPQPLELEPYLQEVAAEYDGADIGRTVRVRASSGTALVDRHLMDNVLGHLLENAKKYTPDGTTIELISQPAAVPGSVDLLVEDDGPGVDESLDLFAPFTRGEHDQRGSGLGLHIVRTLITASGGTVRVSNRGSGGASFVMSLPTPGSPATIGPS